MKQDLNILDSITTSAIKEKLIETELDETSSAEFNTIINSIDIIKSLHDNDATNLEMHVYDLNDNLIVSDIVYNWKFNIDINNEEVIEINIHEQIRDLGLTSGKFYIKFRLNYDIAYELNIDEVSDSRKEIKISGDDLDLFIKFPKFDIKRNRIEPNANFLDNIYIDITNWLSYYENNELQIILKLKDELPVDIDINSSLNLVLPLAEEISTSIILYPSTKSYDVNILKPANLKAKLNLKNKTEIKYSNWDNLTASGSEYVKTRILSTYSSSLLDNTNLNIKFNDYGNFVFYGSAEQRLENFKYKLQKLESYNGSITELYSNITITDPVASAVTTSAEFINNVSRYETLRNDILISFDEYEQYLYYESASYQSSSYGIYTPATWPKSNDEEPYNLYSISASAATTWYTGQKQTASYYDNENLYSLSKMIPIHIVNDEYSSNYIKFIDMIGQSYDYVWVYISQSMLIHDRQESLYEGMSKDLVYSVLKSYGWDGENDNQFDDLWYYALGTDFSGSYQSTSSYNSNETMIYVNTESIARGDISKEIWKRILNNLPYLNKVKGTKEGVRGLINCYGVPDTILRINEYGGTEPIGQVSNNKYSKFTYGLSFSPTSYIKFTSDNETAYEFRLKTNYSGSNQKIISDEGAGIVSLNLNTDNHLVLIDTNYSINFTYLTTSIADNDWWSILLNKVGSGPYTYDLYVKKMANGLLTHEYSSSYSSVHDLFPEHLYAFGETFSGSAQELRLWETNLSESIFDQHVISPTSYHGNNFTASYSQLLQRYTLGTDTKTFNHATSPVLINQAPSQSNNYEIEMFDFPDEINYLPFVEQYSTVWPDLGANRKISNKIRIETGSLDGNLSINKRSEISAYDIYPLDSGKLGIYFSPTNEIDSDIAEQMGGFSIDDYIGAWNDVYNEEYFDLLDIKDFYYSKFTQSYDVNDYLRLTKFFDQGLYRQIKEIVPARTKPITGVVIEPHILNRSKVRLERTNVSMSQFSYSCSIDDIEATTYATYSQHCGTVSMSIFPTGAFAQSSVATASIVVTNTDASIYTRMNLMFISGTTDSREVSNSLDYRRGVQQSISSSVPSEWLYIDTSPSITSYTGTHTPAGSSATILTDSTASFIIDALIGATIYNTTDKSRGIVTDNGSTTVTVAKLIGGTGNKWDIKDIYEVDSNISVSESARIRDDRHISLENLFFNGCKISASAFNVPTSITPDGSPIVEYKITKAAEEEKTIIVQKNLRSTGNFKVS